MFSREICVNTGHVLVFSREICVNTGHVLVFSREICVNTGHVLVFSREICVNTGQTTAAIYSCLGNSRVTHLNPNPVLRDCFTYS